MTMMEFLSDRLRGYMFQTVFVSAAAVFLFLTGTGGGNILLLLVIWLLVLVGTQTADYFRCRAHLHELESIMDGLDAKYLFAECIPKTRDSYERKLLDLSRRAGKAMIGAVSDAQAAQREYREYVERWVHEIKTPITAAGLICHHASPETREKLSRELARIEAHVERALFYARAESPEKDVVVRRVSLEEIVEQAVAHHRTLLIQGGIQVEMENLGQAVYTDEKWAVFVLGQLLQNAVRYRDENPVIRLSAERMEHHVQLHVWDNGIGIPAHELPRIFDRGFTGSNGRARGGSTGMGLYLCRRLADCLEIELEATSEAGRGTGITLAFPAEEKL